MLCWIWNLSLDSKNSTTPRSGHVVTFCRTVSVALKVRRRVKRLRSMPFRTMICRSCMSSDVGRSRKMLRATAARSSWIFCTRLDRFTALTT